MDDEIEHEMETRVLYRHITGMHDVKGLAWSPQTPNEDPFIVI